MSSPARDAWLSLTPEPERDLPAAIATLRAGGTPDLTKVGEERERAEQLVLRGSRRAWVAWLHEAVRLADSRPGVAPELSEARELVLDVITNHDALELGLPGHRRSENGADGETFERIRNEKGRAR